VLERRVDSTDLILDTVDDPRGQSGGIDSALGRWCSFGIGESIGSVWERAGGESKEFCDLGNVCRCVLRKRY